jgi:hypothetical protein
VPDDGAELRLVSLDVDVDVLQLADLLPVAIDQHLAVPLGDVPFGVPLVLGHRDEPPLRSWRRASSILCPPSLRPERRVDGAQLREARVR